MNYNQDQNNLHMLVNMIFQSPQNLKLAPKRKNINSQFEKVKNDSIQKKCYECNQSNISTDLSDDEYHDIVKINHQDLSSDILPVVPLIQPAVQVQKYKTEMCRNWQMYQCCNYGSKCRFAHGMEELQQKQGINSFYKTRDCVLFHSEGFCNYGQRCHFIHENRTQEDVQYNSKVGYRQLLENGLSSNRRLQVFTDICNQY